MDRQTIINLMLSALLLGALWGAEEIPSAVIAAPVTTGAKSIVVEGMHVNAGFYATGSSAWASQGGMHYGVDYGAPHGSPVYMPFDCVYSMTGYYADAARLGQYLICYLRGGIEYYSGHLEGVQAFTEGQMIAAGTLIGFTNEYDHTHIQLRDTSGTLLDFEAYYEEAS